MGGFGNNELVKIDIAHAELIRALVMSMKPNSVLELGVGGGRSTDAIISGLEYNSMPFEFTLVDNWFDFGGQQPKEVAIKYGKIAEIVTSDEKDFVFSTRKTFDFIMSDADHHNTDQWFNHVYDNLLNPNGILIYHDINLFTNDFKNLRRILQTAQTRKLRHILFNRNSLPTERCERGLLVINKWGAPA